MAYENLKDRSSILYHGMLIYDLALKDYQLLYGSYVFLGKGCVMGVMNVV